MRCFDRFCTLFFTATLLCRDADAFCYDGCTVVTVALFVVAVTVFLYETVTFFVVTFFFYGYDFVRRLRFLL